MITFDEMYNMYTKGDEQLYNELCNADFNELIHKCNKNIGLYYDFREWLDDIRSYYE